MSENPVVPPVDTMPRDSRSFIAYSAKPYKMQHPKSPELGTVDARSEVFVRWFPGIVVKNVIVNETNVRVEFDPTSIGLEKSIHGYINTDDQDAIQYLKNAQQSKNPISIGIEYTRRAKVKSTKEFVSREAPIHKLRGAETAEGGGNNAAMLGPSGENTRVVVAYIDGHATKNYSSNLSEWPQLTNNRQGSLPPEGWYQFTDGPWENRTASFIIPAASASGDSIDYKIISDIVQAAVSKALRDISKDEANKQASENGNPTNNAPSNGRKENKPWVTWNSSAQINQGSYAVTNMAYTVRWATNYLEEAGIGGENIFADGLMLADIVNKIADRVQVDIYEGKINVNRMDNSFKEASLWVRDTIEKYHQYEGDSEEWRKSVYETTLSHMRESGNLVAEHFRNAPKASANNNRKEENQKNQVLARLARGIENSWNNGQKLQTILNAVHEQDLAAEPLWLHEKGISASMVNGVNPTTAQQILENRITFLASQNQPSESAVSAAETAPEPSNNTAPVGNTQNNSSTPVSSEDMALAQRISKVTDVSQIDEAFQIVRSANKLQSSVNILRDGPLGVRVVPPSVSSETATYAEVFAIMNQSIQNNSSTDTQAPSSEPATPQKSGSLTAQQYADKFAQGGSFEDLKALHQEIPQDILAETVQVSGASGPLGSYVNSVLRRMNANS